MDLWQQLVEVSMGVGGTGVANNDVDPGSGVIVKKVVPGKKLKKNVADRLRLGSPATSSMIGTNPMMPGRSAFAKGIE